MPYVPDRAASRHARDRDRDLLPAGPRMGPYELRYDVRRGYQEPLRDPGDVGHTEDVLLFRGRDPRDDRGA
jgi:hypothetical protein